MNFIPVFKLGDIVLLVDPTLFIVLFVFVVILRVIER